MADTRISDADKDRAASVLKFHFRAGRLDAEEYSDRLARAYSARTYSELFSVTADLPEHGGPHPSLREGSSALEAANSLGANSLGANSLGANSLGASPFKARPWTLAVAIVSYLFINGLLVLIWALGSAKAMFWPAWPIALWGLFLGAGAFFRARLNRIARHR